jgi:carbon starvation protein CstA
MGRKKCAWISALPMLFVGTTTITAGILSFRDIFWPLTWVPKTIFTGYLNSVLMAMFIPGVVLVLADAARRCWLTLRGAPFRKIALARPWWTARFAWAAAEVRR